MPRSKRTNQQRSQETTAALLEAARRLFVERGYGGTSTPDVCAEAGITRGALYHHFADKQDLFRAVLRREAEAVAAEIAAASPSGRSAAEALAQGAIAYLDAMKVPGRTRLLLVEGPAFLGAREMSALDAAHAEGQLEEGLREALGNQAVPIQPLARLLSAAFDQAALEVEAAASAHHARKAKEAMLWLLSRVIAAAPPVRA